MSRLTLALGSALVVLEVIVAISLVETSSHDSGLGRAFGLAVTAGVAFMVSGLIALWRRPENRTGVYLATVGYLWFFGALTESNNAWIYVVGFVLGGLAFIPFSALLLSHPTGRFETRFDRIFPWIVGAVVVGLSIAIALVDPTLDPECTGCPENPLAMTDAPSAVTMLDAIDTAAGVLLALTAVVLLVRRWRRASHTLRRALWPVLIAGGAALSALVVDGLLDQLVSVAAANVFAPVFLVCFAAVPIAFLFGILRVRLARSSVSELVVALERGEPLRDALAKSLADPSVKVAYWLDRKRRFDDAGWVDAHGRVTPEPMASDARAVTLVERGGHRIAAIEYDVALDAEPELVDAVTAAAGLALQNERLQAELRAEVGFMNTVTNTAPSLLVNIGTDGIIRNINLAALEASGHDDEDAVRGQHYWNVFIDPTERSEMVARFHALAPDFTAGEYENTFVNARGEERTIYWRAAPVQDEQGRVMSIVSGGLDITERHRLEAEKERSHAFLNAIANNAPSLICLIDDQGRVTQMGANIAFEQALEYESEEIGGQVFWDFFVDSEHAPDVRKVIERVVAGEDLGESDNHWLTKTGRSLVVAWTCLPLPRIDERTLFLVSGVDVTQRKRMEDEIRASRARLVRAEDEARRGLERNLHDGAQQRLVALSVVLRLVESKLRDNPASASDLLGNAREELAQALEELRELARGIHPAVLTDRGLRPALEALAGRAPIPVEVTAPTERMSPEVEAAAYYVVAETLTNVAKYARASSAVVRVEPSNGLVAVTVTDDGVGGADPTTGTGLRGLADRVAVLDGTLSVESPAGGGTTVRAEIPLAAAGEK